MWVRRTRETYILVSKAFFPKLPRFLHCQSKSSQDPLMPPDTTSVAGLAWSSKSINEPGRGQESRALAVYANCFPLHLQGKGMVLHHASSWSCLGPRGPAGPSRWNRTQHAVIPSTLHSYFAWLAPLLPGNLRSFFFNDFGQNNFLESSQDLEVCCLANAFISWPVQLSFLWCDVKK